MSRGRNRGGRRKSKAKVYRKRIAQLEGFAHRAWEAESLIAATRRAFDGAREAFVMALHVDRLPHNGNERHELRGRRLLWNGHCLNEDRTRELRIGFEMDRQAQRFMQFDEERYRYDEMGSRLGIAMLEALRSAKEAPC